MRLPRQSSALFTLALPYLAAGTSIDCTHIRADGVSWDFAALGGPKSVVWTEKHWPSRSETTFTIDICKPLKKVGPKDEDCEMGSWGMYGYFHNTV